MAISYRATGIRVAKSAGAILSGLLMVVTIYVFFLALALSDKPGGWTPSFYQGAISGAVLMASYLSGQTTALLAPTSPSLHTGTLATIVFVLLYYNPVDGAVFVPFAIILGGATSKKH
jgi:hypothetical protein